MKMQKSFDRPARPDSRWDSELMQAAERMATFHRISWREAFGKMVSPAFRLHRYRNAHNRVLRGALCELDCPDAGSRKR